MARGEIYLQLSVDFPDDRKVRALARYGKDARPARDLYVQMALYCKRTKSDGHVPDEQVGILVYPDPPAAGARQAKMLADVGLVERRDDGWHVLAFLKRNPSAAQVRADLDAKAEGAARGNHRRWHVGRGVVDPRCPLCSEDRSQDRSHQRSGERDPSDVDRSSIESPETETETETETDDTTPTESAARPRRRKRATPPPAEEPPPDGPPGPAEQIVSDWIASLRKPPPERVASAVGLTVQAALGQDHNPADVAEAIRRWQAKGNLGPAALASFVHEVANGPRNGASGTRSTTDERVAQALEVGRRLQAIHDQRAVGQ